MATLQRISSEELNSMIENGDDMLLINSLSPTDYKKTSIPGAVNIPEKSDDFVDQVRQKAGSKDQSIVVYCANKQCHSSTHAAEKLVNAGYKNVFDFEGGYEDWQLQSNQ